MPKIKNEKIKIIKKPESIDNKDEYIEKINKVKKHIYDGDILIVERRNTARNGETVVAMNDNNDMINDILSLCYQKPYIFCHKGCAKCCKK